MIIVLAVCVLVGIGVVAFWPGEREPEYNGKKLSDWLREYNNQWPPWAPGAISQEAVDAVRHIGTNALPFLVKWIRDDKDVPKWKTKLYDIAYTCNSRFARTKALEIIAQRQLLAYRATWGFEILGQSAGAAIPELTQVARDGNAESAFGALTALSYVGKESIPSLLALANDRNFKSRIQAIGALGGMRRLGADAHPIVVCLIEHLKEPDPKIVCATANVLGRLNLESEISVPALAGLLQSTDAGVRERGLANLRDFGDRARPILPQLLAALRDSNADVRRGATNALQIIAPEVLTNGVKNL